MDLNKKCKLDKEMVDGNMTVGCSGGAIKIEDGPFSTFAT